MFCLNCGNGYQALWSGDGSDWDIGYDPDTVSEHRLDHINTYRKLAPDNDRDRWTNRNFLSMLTTLVQLGLRSILCREQLECAAVWSEAW